MKNISININDIPVGGCVHISTQVSTDKKELGEYLSSQSYAVIKKNTVYEIRLKLMSNHIDYSDKELFALSIQGNGFSVVFSGCSIAGEREYSEDGLVYREMIIKSPYREATYE